MVLHPASANVANNSDFTICGARRERQKAVVMEVQRNTGDFKRHLGAEL